MSWATIGTVTPQVNKWLSYPPITHSPASPLESVLYRVTGLNVDSFDPDRFYALLQFRYGADIYSRAYEISPNAEAEILSVEIPSSITEFPFSWSARVQLFYIGQSRQLPVNWAIRIDEFVEADSIANLLRFIY